MRKFCFPWGDVSSQTRAIMKSLLLALLVVGSFSSLHAQREMRDLQGYFPFTQIKSAEAWKARKQEIEQRLLVGNGLLPMPEKTPLNAVVHGRIDRDTYTVEKVYFESRPGFFVTGNLYRPKKSSGRMPGVLFAHGHWTDARLSEATDSELSQEIATGQERFTEGGRSRFQSMCVQLARMGCVVFQYDMLGNSDSQQITMSVAHTFGKQRPHLIVEVPENAHEEEIVLEAEAAAFFHEKLLFKWSDHTCNHILNMRHVCSPK